MIQPTWSLSLRHHAFPEAGQEHAAASASASMPSETRKDEVPATACCESFPRRTRQRQAHHHRIRGPTSNRFCEFRREDRGTCALIPGHSSCRPAKSGLERMDRVGTARPSCVRGHDFPHALGSSSWKYNGGPAPEWSLSIQGLGSDVGQKPTRITFNAILSIFSKAAALGPGGSADDAGHGEAFLPGSGSWERPIESWRIWTSSMRAAQKRSGWSAAQLLWMLRGR